YGPDPDRVIDLARETAGAIIRGNHDQACSGVTDASDFNPFARAAALWTRQNLTLEHLEFLRQLPPGPLLLPGFEIVHGSVEDEDEYITGAAEAIPALRAQALQLVFFGHTHLQGGFSLNHTGAFRRISISAGQDDGARKLELEDGTRYLINPGSTGQPRDGDRRAAFAILDSDERQVQFYRTSYDLAQTQAKMSRAGLPEPLIHRLEFGR
ncbi:MAG TPA: metallophosphoesterase family protein, partial [Terriglobia bacterium]|nr:metallophosphoesterase family protein [Terriglobia bacterium]